MKVFYGYDVRNGAYWYKVEVNGYEAGGKRGISREEIQKDKENMKHFKWVGVIDTIH